MASLKNIVERVVGERHMGRTEQLLWWWFSCAFWAIVGVLAACFVILECGCAPAPAPAPRPAGPRPHRHALTRREAGGVVHVHAGDSVCIRLPCEWGRCYTLGSDGTPHVVFTRHDGEADFCFRAAAPGQCMVSFSGARRVQFHFHVHP